MFDKLLGHLEYVKTLNEPENNNSENVSCLEGDFHPSSESSRISEDGRSISTGTENRSSRSQLDVHKSENYRRVSVIKHTTEWDESSEAESPRLPPLSPRIIVGSVDEDKDVAPKAFYHDNNIDQLPIRNSPVSERRRVPALKLTKPKHLL